MAAFVSYARLEADKHFLSDTIFGAALGTVVGYSALQARGAEERRHTPEKEATTRSWAIVPAAFADGGGVGVSLRW